MPNPAIIRVIGAELFLLPVTTRVPLKFGTETLTSVTCARVRLHCRAADGREATGWGETPLSVQWVWPSALPYNERFDALTGFCRLLAKAWPGFGSSGHALEVGYDFLEHALPGLLGEYNSVRAAGAHLPWLAALVCASPFDLALHDACGKAAGLPVYETYSSAFLSRDLSAYLTPAADRAESLSFAGKYPGDFLRSVRRERLMAWHLVGGLDPLGPAELNGTEPDDGEPLLLADWIRRDGLLALKVKLRGTDAAWDYARLVKTGRLALAGGVLWLSADFNCTVTDPAYVTEILDRLREDEPRIFALLLYVEQPFPYELEEHPIPAHAVSARRPLFLDESAHDWRQVRTGRALGWTGVALKTCKTQTGALLSLAWASAHGMTLMVQDLTNPMLAQIAHALLAAWAPTIAGVETNAMQFYPAASAAEAAVHPALYRRRDGQISVETVNGSGFGMREEEIVRILPAADTAYF
ncbi:MAG: enolase superfamily enzyme related to L-alanine-DL-glutamate epimerase [Verrucomicrobiales bacterium]|nr:enolase superfamily enzyme related to L-alanine-DL-glutamate epimerase [Verrucomicrobiales bacterium]